MDLAGNGLLPLWGLGFLISCLSPLLVKKFGMVARWPILSVPFAFSTYFSLAAWHFEQDRVVKINYSWVSLFKTGLSFSLDGLSLVFCLLISFFGLIIMFFASEYLKSHRDLGKFYFFILLFMLSMIGLVLADHLILLFVFWELTTFSSFLLIGFEHEKVSARNSAWQAILITTSGGLAMLAGFILLGQTCQTYQISEILKMGETVRNSVLYLPIILLILAGAFTKSAQFPFYFWLPGAMEAPTPVSAYLHSATMVKAGIYLMARFSPVLANTAPWVGIVTTVGVLTMLTGAIFSLKQTDLKLLLAYMTIMALGALTFLLGLGSIEAVKAAIIFLVAHSFYKGSLFLITGAIDHGAGTRQIANLGGLLRVMPWTSAAAFVSLVSMAGLLPAIGFISKEMIYKATLIMSGSSSYLVISSSVLAMAISTATAGIFFFKVFLGKKNAVSIKAHEHSWKLWGPPLLLGLIGLALGLSTSWMNSNLIKSSVGAIWGETVMSTVFAGTKLDNALLLSTVSTLLGVVLYLYFEKIKSFLDRFSEIVAPFSPPSLYFKGQNGLLFLATKLTDLTQRGYQLKYLTVIVLVVIISLSFSIFQINILSTLPDTLPRLEFYEWIILSFITGATIGALMATSLIAVVLLLGVVGYGIALLFVIYGAPDLALTQFLIETLTIILIALIAIKFPLSVKGKDSRSITFGKGLVALAFGSLMTLILWNVMNFPFDPYLSQYFSANSFPLGKGRNIVNVILVDFRALDTLGEITVLAVGSLSFYSLIKLARREGGVK